MRRLFIAAAIVVSAVSMSSAQKFEAGIDFGYGLGIGDSVGNNKAVNGFGDPTSWEQVYGARGNGWKAQAEGTFYFNENFGIIALSEYSWAGGYSTKNVQGNNNVFVDADKVETSYLSASIGIKLRTKMLGIVPYIYIAPGLFLPREKETKTNGIFAQPDEIITYSFAPGFGFTGGAGAALMVFDRIGVKLEITPTFASANVTQYTHEQAGNPTTTVIYKNNTVTLPPDTQDTSYQHDQPRYTFNSVAAKAGVFFCF